MLSVFDFRTLHVADHRALIRAALFLVGVSVPTACGSGISGDTAFYINVGLQNSTTLTLTIQVSDEVLEVAPGYTSTEVNGVSGDVITFLVLSGADTLGNGQCTATNAIVGTSQYGQVNFYFEQPSGIFTVECSSGWVESS